MPLDSGVFPEQGGGREREPEGGGSPGFASSQHWKRRMARGGQSSIRGQQPAGGKQPTATTPQCAARPPEARNRKVEAPRFRSRADPAPTASAATAPWPATCSHGCFFVLLQKFRDRNNERKGEFTEGEGWSLGTEEGEEMEGNGGGAHSGGTGGPVQARGRRRHAVDEKDEVDARGSCTTISDGHEKGGDERRWRGDPGGSPTPPRGRRRSWMCPGSIPARTGARRRS